MAATDPKQPPNVVGQVRTQMDELVVSESVYISGRGAVVFFDTDPEPIWEWCQHRVEVRRPNGESFQTTAGVDFAYHGGEDHHESMGLVFPSHKVVDLPPGSRIVHIKTFSRTEGQ